MSDELKQFIAELRERDWWRFRDLERLGIVHDRATLRRWMRVALDPFPQPIVMSANSIAWSAGEVRQWLERRRRGPAPQPRHIEKMRALAATEQQLRYRHPSPVATGGARSVIATETQATPAENQRRP